MSEQQSLRKLGRALVDEDNSLGDRLLDYALAWGSEIESLRQQLAEAIAVQNEVAGIINPGLIEQPQGRDLVLWAQRQEDERRAFAGQVELLEQQLAESRAGRVPEGWKPAPHQPTKDMIEAATKAVLISQNDARLIYASMLFMAPQPPAGGVVLEGKPSSIRLGIDAVLFTGDALAAAWRSKYRNAGNEQIRSNAPLREELKAHNSALCHLRALLAQPQQEVGK